MDKYDYVTTTIEEEKERIYNILLYLDGTNDMEEYSKYKERYNNICKYLNAKERYINIYSVIKEYRSKLQEVQQKEMLKQFQLEVQILN